MNKITIERIAADTRSIEVHFRAEGAAAHLFNPAEPVFRAVYEPGLPITPPHRE